MSTEVSGGGKMGSGGMVRWKFIEYGDYIVFRTCIVHALCLCICTVCTCVYMYSMYMCICTVCTCAYVQYVHVYMYSMYSAYVCACAHMHVYRFSNCVTICSIFVG